MKVFYTNVTLNKGAYNNNPYSIHQILWELFPGVPTDGRQFLFRTTPSLDGRLHILMQSSVRPTLEVLDELTGEVVSCSERLLPFGPDKSYQFVLYANPTTSKDGKRSPITYSHGLNRWLARKLEGVAIIESVMTIVQPSFVFEKEGVRGRAHSVLFAGFLRVVNIEIFNKLIVSGIGRAKFLGMGLMTLAETHDFAAATTNSKNQRQEMVQSLDFINTSL